MLQKLRSEACFTFGRADCCPEVAGMKWLWVGLYFAGLLVEVIIRRPYDRAQRKIAKSDRRVTFPERALFAGLYVAVLLVPGIYGVSSWLSFADYNSTLIASRLVGSCGVAFLVVAIWLFWRAHRDLGTNWSPSLEIGVRHTLITHGVYRLVRHPMYASQFLYCVAQALLLHNWIAGLAGFVAFVPFYLVRVPEEERMMLNHFGDRYEEYCERTGRLVPRLRG
jgi:protein-S-isoprenylcysteine O-methyltransferase Ste14